MTKKNKYRRVQKNGKPFAPTLTGYRLVRQEDGAPYTIWVGKKYCLRDVVDKREKKG